MLLLRWCVLPVRLLKAPIVLLGLLANANGRRWLYAFCVGLGWSIVAANQQNQRYRSVILHVVRILPYSSILFCQQCDMHLIQAISVKAATSELPAVKLV